MRKSCKKLISLVLVVMLVLTSLTLVPTSVAAAEEETTFQFIDNQNWGTCYLYVFNDNGDLGAAWPGVSLESFGVNDSGEKLYEINVPAGATGIVLSNGNGDQTVDITDFDVTGYYATGDRDGEGHLLVISWTDEPATEPVTEPDTEPETEPETEPVTEPVPEPVTEPETEPDTEPVTEPDTEPETEPETEPVTGPVPVDPPNNDVYVVSGNANLCSDPWNPVLDENVMSYYSDGLYRITFQNVTHVTNAIYSFKVVRFQNGNSYYSEWIGNNGSDYNVDFSLSQSCDVTITFDPATREILVEGDGVIPPANQIEYITAVGVSNGNFLNGSDWDPLYTPNRMEETENGVYEITFPDVYTQTDYQFKFAANGDWDINWGGESGNYAATDVYHPAYFNSSYNIEFYIDDDEDYADVTLVLDIRNWNPVSKEGATYAILVNQGTPEPENVINVKFIDALGWDHPVAYAYDSNGDILPEASASEPIRSGRNERKEMVYTFSLPEETAYFAFGDGDKLTTTASDKTKTYYTLGDLTLGDEYVLLEDNPNFSFSIKGTIDYNRFINAQVNSNVVSAYRFIPAEDADIVFTSMSDNDTYGYLYDANGYQIDSDDDNGDNGNFRIVYHLTAGQTYYLGCRYYSSYNSGVIPISLEKGEYQQNALEINSVNAYGNGHNGFLNDYEWRTDENQMTEIQKDVYAISFDNIISDEYSFRFCVNGNSDNYFCDDQWSRQPNTIYDAYYWNSYDCRFYLSEESNVTLIFDAREYDPQTMSGAKYEVIAEPVSSTRQIRSLTLLDNPTKTSYIAGEKVDLTGMTLVALYSDRTSEFVDYCDVSPLVITENTTEVTLTYKGLTQSFPVTVAPAVLTSLVLVKLPTQRWYYEGDAINMEDCVVKAVYNDGAMSSTITDYTVSADLSTPGIKTVTLSYGGKSLEFDVYVKKLYITEFWIDRSPDKTEYYRGETFDPTGMELMGRYNSGKTFIVEDYTVTGFSTESFGEGNGYAVFTIDNMNDSTISTEFHFNVVPRTLAIALTAQPEKTEYIKGEQLDTTGLQVYVVMEDGTAHEIPAKVSEEEAVSERTMQFTNNQNWDECIMIAYNEYWEDEYVYPYDSYTNDYGETVYLYAVPDYAVQLRFTNGDEELTDYTSDLNVAGYYTTGDITQDGSLYLYSWGEPGDGIPTDHTVTDGYTVSELNEQTGRQTITVEYKDKQAYFFVDVFDKGDVNRDGVVSVADVTALQKYLVELYDLDDFQTQLADINDDGETDIRDATLIQMLISEIV